MRHLAVVFVLLSCASTRQHRHVVVAQSPEGGKCVRECMTIAATCEAAATVPLSRDSRRRKCEGDRNECLLTCPGAREELRTEVHAKGRPGFECDERMFVDDPPATESRP